MDDIVKKILRKHENLKSAYYETLDTFTEGHIEEAKLSTKLHSLASSVCSSMYDNNLSSHAWLDILDDIEEYALSLENEETEEEFEVMFIETCLNVMSHIEENDERYIYVRIFKRNLWPKIEELCRRNNDFWQKISESKNF